MLLYRFVQSHEEPPKTALLSPTNLSKKNLEGERTNTLRRSGSEFSMASDFSLGMSRTDSLADIINLTRGIDSLGDFCTSGKIAVEVLKFLGSGVVVCGVVWKLLDATAPPQK